MPYGTILSLMTPQCQPFLLVLKTAENQTNTQQQKSKELTFSFYKVPDLEGPRHGPRYNHLLSLVEPHTVNRGCVARKALKTGPRQHKVKYWLKKKK